MLLLATAFLQPQEAPRVDAAVNYSHLQVLKGYTISMNGASGSVAYNFNNWIGLAADIGIYHGYPAQSLTGETFTLGPRLSYRGVERFQPFVQALFGGSHFNASSGGITGGGLPFANDLGFGADLALRGHRKFALRLADDFFGTRSGGSTTISNRVSAGIVFRFGR
jgi:hypothetical protein